MYGGLGCHHCLSAGSLLAQPSSAGGSWLYEDSGVELRRWPLTVQALSLSQNFSGESRPTDSKAI